jgi:hypothetical protein
MDNYAMMKSGMDIILVNVHFYKKDEQTILLSSRTGHIFAICPIFIKK